MRGFIVNQVGELTSQSLRLAELPDPELGPGEVLVRVSVCGVCRTDLHIIEGDLLPMRGQIVPGHQIVGRVASCGGGVRHLRVGDRLGIAWLRSTCGECEFCRSGRENLCAASRYTGYHANGGYGEYAVVNEEYAYLIPDCFSDVEAAPLLCAGIIGFRALERAQCPHGGKLGIFGFGSSAHLTMQIAHSRGVQVFVGTRSVAHQNLAQELGARWVGDGGAPFPEPLDSVIVFAPSGDLVPRALASLKPGGTVSIAGIHLSEIPAMNYASCLFHEKNLVSVESNTRADGRAFIEEAARIALSPHTQSYHWQDAPRALCDLKEERVVGTAVLRFD